MKPVVPLLVLGLACGCLPIRRAPMGETGPKPHPIAPPKRAAIDAAIKRGIDFLLTVQNKDGSWGNARRTKGLNIYAPVPGAHHAFRTAVTALCISAFIEARDPRPDAQAALARGE